MRLVGRNLPVVNALVRSGCVESWARYANRRRDFNGVGEDVAMLVERSQGVTCTRNRETQDQGEGKRGYYYPSL